MIFEEALDFVEFTLKTKTGKQLSDPEKEILKAAWDNETYNDIADSLYLSVGYIKDLASLLWQKISKAIDIKVTKSNFRFLLESQGLTNQNIYNNFIAKPNAQLESNKGNILIVDDLPENLDFLTKILIEEGYKVRSVTNGKMTIRTVKNNPPDLILMDIKMPDMDGYQVCEALKINPNSSEIPIIFLSALDNFTDKVKALQIGGVDYITKPFYAEEVIARIETHLTIQKQKIQLREEIEKHQQSVEILYQSRTLLANLLNTSSDGIAAIQAVRNVITGEINDFFCVVINTVFTQLLGKTRKELMGQANLKEIFNQISPVFFDLLINVVESEDKFNQKTFYVKNSICENYYFIINKFGDGCSITARNITQFQNVVSQFNC